MRENLERPVLRIEENEKGRDMENEVIITGYTNPTTEGVTLHTNIKAKLKGGNMKVKSIWVSWDKIGSALFENYTDRVETVDLNELRGS